MTAIELAMARATAAEELARVDAEIAALAAASRAGNIAAVRALMAEHGLTAADLGHVSASKASKPAKAKRAPMYGNLDGQTWVGIGKRPGWLNAALAGGASLQSFRLCA